MDGRSGEGLPINTTSGVAVSAHGGKQPLTVGNEFQKIPTFFVIAPLFLLFGRR